MKKRMSRRLMKKTQQILQEKHPGTIPIEPSLSTGEVKKRARIEAEKYGHVLGYFIEQLSFSTDPYWITYCSICYAPVACSPTKWLPRIMGGRALREFCEK